MNLKNVSLVLLTVAIVAVLSIWGFQCPLRPTGISMMLLDDPVDEVAEINVLITSITVHGNGSPVDLPLSAAAQNYVNILDMQNGLFTTLVDGAELAPGHYGNIHIGIADANVVVKEGDEPQPLDIPPDKIKLITPFDIVEGQITELFIVFDARHSLKYKDDANKDKGYKLNPTIKVEDKVVSGSVSGTVVPAPAVDEAGNGMQVVVYADPLEDIGTAASVIPLSDGTYKLVPLREGTYTIRAVFTEVVANEAITTTEMVYPETVTVVAEQDTPGINFTLAQ